jgi:hypothetical protein
MTLGQPREHVLSKKLCKIADLIEAKGQIDAAPGVVANELTNAPHARRLAADLDMCILSLGIWKDAQAIANTNAYAMAKRFHDQYLKDNPGVRL